MSGQQHRHVVAAFLTSRPETNDGLKQWHAVVLVVPILYINKRGWNNKCMQNFRFETSAEETIGKVHP
jgi:hypothetical protein